jgi:hypothetical protein
VWVERVLWAWAGDVPVLMSWAGPDKICGHWAFWWCYVRVQAARSVVMARGLSPSPLPKPPRAGPRPKGGTKTNGTGGGDRRVAAKIKSTDPPVHLLNPSPTHPPTFF